MGLHRYLRLTGSIDQSLHDLHSCALYDESRSGEKKWAERGQCAIAALDNIQFVTPFFFFSFRSIYDDHRE